MYAPSFLYTLLPERLCDSQLRSINVVVCDKKCINQCRGTALEKVKKKKDKEFARDMIRKSTVGGWMRGIELNVMLTKNRILPKNREFTQKVKF